MRTNKEDKQGVENSWYPHGRISPICHAALFCFAWEQESKQASCSHWHATVVYLQMPLDRCEAKETSWNRERGSQEITRVMCQWCWTNQFDNASFLSKLHADRLHSLSSDEHMAKQQQYPVWLETAQKLVFLGPSCALHTAWRNEKKRLHVCMREIVG